jgi:hypothetical protein
MSSHERVTSIPSGIRAICVVDGYLVLLGMALAMIGLADLDSSPWLDFTVAGVEGISWMILGMLVLVAIQMYVIQGVWNIKSWSWTAMLGVLVAQIAILAGLIGWVLTGDSMPISYADGVVRWALPLIVLLGSVVYLIDKREWFTDL